MPETKLKLGMRTIKKVVTQLGLGCSNCGWDLAPCDIHHIVEQRHGGSDDHDNLTLLCPNCHRLAHVGKITKFKNIEDQFREVGNDKVFHGLPKFSRVAKIKIKSAKIEDRRKGFEERKQLILASGIDFSKWGWQTSLGKILGISSQKSAIWIKKHMPELLKNADNK